MNRSFLVFLLVSVLVAAPPGPRSNLTAQTAPDRDVVWPLPPNPPRIRYTGYIHSDIDVGRTLSFGARMKRAVLGTRASMLGLRRPHDIYVDDGSRFYITDKHHGGVVVYDKELKAGVVWKGEGPGQLSRPLGLGGDGEGHLYVADPGTQRVVVLDTAGGYVTALGGPPVLRNPVDVVVDVERDRVYVVDSHVHQVVVFNRNGELISRIGRDEAGLDTLPPPPMPEGHGAREPGAGPRDVFVNRGSGPGEFRFPSFAAVAPDGTLYVSDAMNFRVQVFDAEGSYLREIGRAGDVPGTFARPKGVAVNSEGHVYVVDAAFNNVQIFDEQGRLLLVFGGMGRGGGELWFPEGVHINKEGRIFVVDAVNSRVQVYDYLADAGTDSEGGKDR